MFITFKQPQFFAICWSTHYTSKGITIIETKLKSETEINTFALSIYNKIPIECHSKQDQQAPFYEATQMGNHLTGEMDKIIKAVKKFV